MCDIHTLLPPLKLASIQELEATKLLHIFVLIVVVVKIQLGHLIESARELAPNALPLFVACLTPGPSQTCPGTDIETTSGARVRPPCWLGSRASNALNIGILRELEEVGTLHAVPVAFGNLLQTNAVGVVGGVAAIAEQEDILTVGRVANGAWVALFFLDVRVVA